MSRFLRNAGSSGGSTYGDSNVCGLLPSYTGTLTAGDGTNICCIRTDWELICECNGIDECYGAGGCVEFTFPSTADSDNCKFTAYKLEVTGLSDGDATAKQLFMKIGNADCYCTCCAGQYRCTCFGTCTNYNNALCLHCIPVSGASHFRGGNVEACFYRFPFFPACVECDIYGICYTTRAFTMDPTAGYDFCNMGFENCCCRTCWEEFCKVALNITPSCIFVQCGSFRMYGKRHRGTSYSGYTQS